MPTSLEQFKKLRGMSLREIKVRSGQQLSKLGERFFGGRLAEMSEAALRHEVAGSVRNGTGSGTAGVVMERLRRSASASGDVAAWPHWLPSFAHRREIVAMMETRFVAERQTVIERAERAAAGKFDLLGLKDLSFGSPINWHLDPNSGKRTPLVHWSELDYLDPLDGGDQKVLWELNRHAHFVTFGQAYWLTSDEHFVRSFIEQATSWMDANPPTLGINWASSLEVAFRSISWLWSLHLCAHSPLLTASFGARLIEYLIRHGRHIESYLSYYYSPNTHLTGEALGLFYLGAALPELRRSKIWRETGLQILLEQLPLQVRDDGVYFEQTSYYHRYTADFYTHLLLLARGSGVNLRSEIEERLALLFDHLMWITRPDGTSPLFGDDDGGQLIRLGFRPPNDFRNTLAAGAGLFDRGDWKLVAGEAPSELLWLMGPGGMADYDRIVAEPPRESAWAFDESGYFIARDGWLGESSYLLMDCGPHGAPIGCGHAHADALAIEFAAGGQNWLVDPGTFVYDADLRTRDDFRSTEAHNTVVVDGQSQSVPGGPFSWGPIAESRLAEFSIDAGGSYFEGSHDGYRRLADPVTHTRGVLFVKADVAQDHPAFLAIHDIFSARDHHRYALNFHLPASCKAVADGSRARACEPGGKVLTIASLSMLEMRSRVRDGWVSQCYAQRSASPVIVFEADGQGPQEFVTLIFPDEPHRAAGIEQLLSRHLQAGSVKQFLTVLLSGKWESAGEITW